VVENHKWLNGQEQLHRENDLPAVVNADGTREWWVNGERHRDDLLPAIINTDGTSELWEKGELIPIVTLKKE
jgi:hypothetical protein